MIISFFNNCISSWFKEKVSTYITLLEQKIRCIYFVFIFWLIRVAVPVCHLTGFSSYFISSCHCIRVRVYLLYINPGTSFPQSLHFSFIKLKFTFTMLVKCTQTGALFSRYYNWLILIYTTITIILSTKSVKIQRAGNAAGTNLKWESNLLHSGQSVRLRAVLEVVERY